MSREETLADHLGELRTRLIRACIGLLLCLMILLPFSNSLYSLLSEPLRALLPEGGQMIATDVASPFLAPFKLSLVTAIFASLPWLVWQAWGFIAPGLYEREKRFAVPLVLGSTLLFYLGAAFAFFVACPLIFSFLTQAAPDDITIMTDISRYLDFTLKLLMAFGLAFQTPILTMVLVWTGITTVPSLRKKRPFVITGCFVISMFLTPPDIFSQTFLAIPMWLLYEAGLVMSCLLRRAPDVDPGPQQSQV
jgi:sec-independent protein translocase protein TatC